VAPDQNEIDKEYRSSIRAHLERDDWHGAYEWAKGWISGGGGATLLDPWLAYVASALLQGQPRTATHSIDLALRSWIPRRADRSVLHWTRSRIIRFRLNDPKTACTDLERATQSTPSWLRAEVRRDIEDCAAESALSRKRKPSVTPAPDFQAEEAAHMLAVVSNRLGDLPEAGSQPGLWVVVHPYLQRCQQTSAP